LERVRVAVLDERGHPLPPGATGRVAVYSPGVALAAVPALDDPTVLVPGRFLTGDLGVLDEAGRLTLTGRLADVLNVAGKKVHPEEVRKVLESVAGVRAAVVVGLPDARRGQLVAAMVEAESGSTVTVRALRAWCRARLAPHKVPRRLLVVDSLPVNERGKLQREVVVELLTRAGTVISAN
jgi:acyl-coenzyme A synthetase/AMP-(fatty) acid ligase